jgi:hypothetical protein
VTRRLVAVLAPPPATGATGRTDELRLAMVEDVYETVAALELVEPAIVVPEHDPQRSELAALAWPGTELHLLPADAGPGARTTATGRALRLLADCGADQVTVVAGDAPDLPGLLLGKLHRALGSADVAVLPSEGGGLVAVAARCPLPSWLDPAAGTEPDLDADTAVASLRAAAPRRTAVSVGPGWHRVRSRADLQRLDPGLEGWEVTRELLLRS